MTLRKHISLAAVAMVGAIMLTACGGSSSSSGVTEEPAPELINPQPIASAGDDRMVDAGTMVTLDASDSTDPKGEELSYSWRLVSVESAAADAARDVVLINPDSPNPTFRAPEVGQTIRLVFDLVVTEKGGFTATDEVTITVVTPPTASVDVPDEPVGAGDRITLDGSGSVDPGGGAVIFVWSQVGAGPKVEIDDLTAVRPTFIAPIVEDNITLTFELRVINADGVEQTIPIEIKVEGTGPPPVYPPTADAGEDAVVNSGATVTLDGSGSRRNEAVDGSIYYSWKQITDVELVLFNDFTATPTFTAPVVAADTVVRFRLTVVDDQDLQATDEVVLTIDAPPVARVGDGQNVLPGSTVTLRGSGSDIGGGTVGYAWTLISAGDIALMGATLATATFTAPTVTQDTAYTFRFTVTDDQGLTATGETTITVRVPPTVSAGDDQNVLPGSSVTLRGSGSDPGGGAPEYAWTQISGDSIALSNPAGAMPTFSVPATVTQDIVYAFRLTVTDDHGLTVSDEVTVTVRVPPTVDAGTRQDVVPGDAVTLRGSGSDPGGGEPGYAWEQISNANPITLSAIDVAMPTFTAPARIVGSDVDNEYGFRLTVTDEHGLAVSDEVTVIVHGSADADAGDDQNVGAGATVTLDGSNSVGPRGSDPQYTWSTTTTDVTLSDANAAMPTFEAPFVENSVTYIFTLTILNEEGASITDEVTIVVAANQDPIARAGDDQNATAGITITLDGSQSEDPEGGELTYSWILISPRIGVPLSDPTAASITFEAPTGSLGGVFTFQLVVTDPGGKDDTDTISIRVTNNDVSSIAGQNHGITVSTNAINDDGNLVVSGGFDGVVRLWNAVTGQELFHPTRSGCLPVPQPGTQCSLGMHDGVVHSVAISADGLRAISGGADGRVRLWDTITYQEIMYGEGDNARSLSEDDLWVYAVAISADGGKAASGSFSGTVRFWNDTATGVERKYPVEQGSSVMRSLGQHVIMDDNDTPADDSDDTSVPTSVYSVSLSDDGGRLLSGGADGTVRLWDTTEGTQIYNLEHVDDGDPAIPMGPALSVALSGDGNLAVSGNADNHVHIWNVTGTDTGAETRVIDPEEDVDVTSVALTSDRILSASANGQVHLWRLDGTLVHQMRLHTDYVWSAVMSPNGRIAASVGSDGAINFWDVNSNPPSTISPFTPAFSDSDADPSDPPGDVFVTDLLKPPGERAHSGDARSVVVSADGRHVLSGGRDRDVHFWDAVTHDYLRPMDPPVRWGNGPEVWSVALAANGRIGLSGDQNDRMYLWDTATGEDIAQLGGDHGNNVVEVSLSADGRFALSGGQYGAVRLWNVGDLNDIREITLGSHAENAQDQQFIEDVALNASGSRALSASQRTQTTPSSTPGGPDETTYAWDLRLWDTATATTLNLHDATNSPRTGDQDVRIGSVALSADGTLALSGTSDGKIDIWEIAQDMSSAQWVRQIDAHTSSVKGLGLSGDGRFALSGSLDRYVRLWSVKTGAKLRERHLGEYVESISLSADGRFAVSGTGSGKVSLWNIGRSSAVGVQSANVVTASSDQNSAPVGESTTLSLTLDGEAAGPAPLAYYWRQTTGPAMSLSGADTTQATITSNLPLVGSAALRFDFVITDSRGLTVADEVSVDLIGAAMLSVDNDGDADAVHAVRSVAVSRDGRRAVSGGLDGTVRFWNAYTGAEITFVEEEDDGKTPCDDDADADGDTRSLGKHNGAVYAVAISDNGRIALSGGLDGTVCVWDTVNGRDRGYRNPDRGSLSTGGVADTDGGAVAGGAMVYAVALNGDGTRAAAAGFDGKVRYWNNITRNEADSGEEKKYSDGNGGMRSLGQHSILDDNGTSDDTTDDTITLASVYALSMNSTGTRLLSGSADGTVRLWNTETGAELYTLTDDDAMGPVFGVALNSDGTRAISGGADNHIHVWNTETGTELREIEAGPDGDFDFDVTSVALSADGNQIASAHGDGRVRLWSATTGAAITSARLHTDYVWSVALRGNDRLSVSGSNDGTIQFWDTRQSATEPSSFASTEQNDRDPNILGDVIPKELVGHASNRYIDAVAMSGDGRFAISGNRGGEIRLWDAITGSFLRVMECDRYYDSVDSTNRDCEGEAHPGGHGRVEGVALSDDGSLAASVGSTRALSSRIDKTNLRLWNTSDGTQVAEEELEDGYYNVRDVALSGNGRVVMTAAEDQALPKARIWDWNGSSLTQRQYPPEENADNYFHAIANRIKILTVALNRDGSIAVSGNEHEGGAVREVNFLNVNASAREDTIIHSADTGGGSDVLGVALNGDGTKAVVGEKTTRGGQGIQIWDLSDHSNVTLEREMKEESIQSVDMTSIGNIVISGGGFHHLKLWDATTGTMLYDLARRDAHGDLNVLDVAISDDGGTAISGGYNGKTFLWRIGRSRPQHPPAPSGSGSSPPSLVGTAPQSVTTMTTSDATAQVSSPSPVGATSPSATRTSMPLTPMQATPDDTGTTCLTLAAGNGRAARGQARGANCAYPASLFGTDNPLQADMTIPALPNGGAHVFQDALVVASGATLTIEAGTTLAFEGASSSLVIEAGAHLLAVGTAEQPITFIMEGDVRIQGDGDPTGSSGQIEFVVVKAAAADAGSGAADGIALRDVGAGTVVRNLQVYASPGDGLVLAGGAVNIENFVAVYVRGNAIDIDAGWSGSMTNALVIQSEHGGEHCLDIRDADSEQGRGEGPRATIAGLTCITSSHVGGEEARGLGAGIRLGAGTGAAPIIERSLVVGTFSDDTDARLNYCLHIDSHSPQTSDLALRGNIFACEDKVGDTLLEAWVTSRNNQFADVDAPTDPTSATDTGLQLLGGTPPVYSLDYDELRVNGADTTVTPPAGADFPGAASQSAAPSWLRPGGVDWTYGIFEGSRAEPLWFEGSR